MRNLKLDMVGELKLAAEWYAHPSARIWKETIYPQLLQNIMSGLRSATSEDSRAVLQGALIVANEINETLRGAENALRSIQARAEPK